MARTKGTANLSGTIEALAGGPLDARSVVPTKADLTLGSNFPYPYIGLETYVTAENKKYRLVGDDPTVEENWEEVGSGGSSLPAGGTSGQALLKHSAADGDAEWGSVILASAKGTASGVAELDSNGKVPSSQLPSFVDDVVEGYYKAADDRFYEESTFETLIPPESGISWVDIAGNKSYRWTGSAYVRVDEGVQLGETSDTAYRGDRGKTAYNFSQAPYTSTPAMDGTGSAGSSNAWAKGDHVHPKDTTKADKVSGATSGHLAALNSSGNLTDSGKALSDLQAKLTAGDGIVINSSTNTISADVSYLIGAYDIYDSTERVVGYYYGKPLYRKTINFGALANNAQKDVSHGISNIDTIINVRGIFDWNPPGIHYYLHAPHVSSENDTSFAISLWATKTQISAKTFGNWSNSLPTGYVFLQYTKTTDSASSVSYGHENQYSTSEQIVGTWIDGKPIYQKTFSLGTYTATTGNYTKTVPHGISNFNRLISVSQGCAYSGTWGNRSWDFILNDFGDSSLKSKQKYISADSTNIYIDLADYDGFSEWYITIQYTKTT